MSDSREPPSPLAGEAIDKLGLGRLARVDPRTVWKNEAADLTPWLQENLDVLAEALGTEIIPTQREVRVGSYVLDILGEDPIGRPIIIENQLEATNHTHLGQLLVYASGLEAAVVVWLTRSFREEHRRALDWLNERTDDEVHFFGVELDVVRIASSPAAPVFRVVARPNDWQKAVKRQTRISETAQLRHEFFEQVMDGLMAARPTFRKPKVGHENWVSMASGPFGYYALSFAKGDRLRVEAYLDTGDQSSTKRVFDQAHADKASIESEFGEPLAWERLDDRRASRVALYREAPDLAAGVSVEEAREWAIKRISRLMEVLDQRLRDAASAARS